MPGSVLKVCVVGGGGGGVRTKFSVQIWSQAEQNLKLNIINMSAKESEGPTQSVIYSYY